MSPFFIFAIVLTVAYLIYYTVVILHDLYGKKGEKKSEELGAAVMALVDKMM